MTENKFSKYLLYAIGEILLVVIGILIALQVNDWNENRKNDEVRRTYYVQILQDLEKDRILMEEVILNQDSFRVKMESYKEIFKQPDLPIWDIAIRLGEIYSENRYLNIKTNTNTINTLENTGDIQLIPPLIRNKVLDFKRNQSGAMDHIQLKTVNILTNAMSISTLYGGNGDLGMRAGNQPKLRKHFDNENIQVQSLMALEAMLFETWAVNEEMKKFYKVLLLDIVVITKLINEEMKK